MGGGLTQGEDSDLSQDPGWPQCPLEMEKQMETKVETRPRRPQRGSSAEQPLEAPVREGRRRHLSITRRSDKKGPRPRPPCPGAFLTLPLSAAKSSGAPSQLDATGTLLPGARLSAQQLSQRGPWTAALASPTESQLGGGRGLPGGTVGKRARSTLQPINRRLV